MRLLLTTVAISIICVVELPAQVCDFQFFKPGVERLYFGSGVPPAFGLFVDIDSVVYNENGHQVTHYTIDNGEGSRNSGSYTQTDSGYVYPGEHAYKSAYLLYKLCAAKGERWPTILGYREYIGETTRLWDSDTIVVKMFRNVVVDTSLPEEEYPRSTLFVMQGFGTVHDREDETWIVPQDLIGSIVNGRHYGVTTTSINSEEPFIESTCTFTSLEPVIIYNVLGEQVAVVSVENETIAPSQLEALPQGALWAVQGECVRRVR